MSSPPGGSPTDENIVLRVLDRRVESSDCDSLVFARPRGLQFQAGDWVDLRFLTEDLAVGRTFSFSSAPTEPELWITYKHGVTPFKRALDEAKAGDVLLITQYGSNGFVRRAGRAATFIAGGIGIAPFRSMIREAADTGDDTEIRLVQVNRDPDMPFGGELADIAAAHPWLDLRQHVTARDGRLTAKALAGLAPQIGPDGPDVYVVGPPAMVDATERHLKALGVDPERTFTDRFDGY
jgi:ferredoxin-NADP reductase